MSDDDVGRVRANLRSLEGPATKMPWANERCWTAESHVWWERGVVIVDLHDLGVRLAVQAVESVAEVAEAIETGAVIYVTGRGKHSIGGHSPLRAAVWETLVDQCEARGWSARATGPGRLVLIIDAARAPAAATGSLGTLFWAVALVFGLALAYLCMAGG